jgi:LuxR family transcriptional regulator, maltose regulon positive regulatory protein
MGESGVRDWASRPRREGGSAFELYASKLHRPPTRPGTIRRSALIKQLADGNPSPIVSVVAPPGYGKTTLLSQWAEAAGQAVAWVSVDQGDNDPKVLLTYVAEALDAVEPIDEGVFDALASPTSSVPGSVIPRLGSALWSMPAPVALVLDDVHVLDNRECLAALSALADHVPSGSRLVLAGRTGPPLRIARLRAEGRITEIGPGDLSLTREEAASLLRDAGVVLGDADMAELHRRTEGWPAGLYLAALYLREGGAVGRAAVTFGGDDRLVSEYMESEFLDRISQRQRTFLTRTAVLDRMCGPLCETVLDLPGAGAILTDLSRSNMLVVPLDRRGEWYRYHHLFRDMLLAELARLEPGQSPVLRRRAASWCLRSGLAEEALEYSIAAQDVDTAAGLVENLCVPTYYQGRRSTSQRWLRWLEDHNGIEGRPMAAAVAAFIYILLGRPVQALRWAAVVDRWQYRNAARPEYPAAEAWAAFVRALLCRDGVEQMRANADEAVHRFTAEGIVQPGPLVCQGLARAVSGDPDGADESFADAVSVAEQARTHEALVVALCERSLLAMARNQWERAEVFADQVRPVVHHSGIEQPTACTVLARTALHRGDLAAVRRHLVAAQRVRPELTYAFPVLAVQVQIELTRVHLALADLAGARKLMQEADEVLRRRPDLGTLAGEAQELRNRLANERDSSAPGASALTTAELRLIPLLSTHLSFPEIAAELFVSRNTVKSQVLSIYRKLGASSRSGAVSRAREVGILEGLSEPARLSSLAPPTVYHRGRAVIQ